MFFGLTRVMLAMSRDGLLPKHIAKIHAGSSTPRRVIWGTGIIMASIAGFFPITGIANLVNIGTLAAFVAVSMSVIVLRYTKPHLPRPFKVPFSPLVPSLGVMLSLYLMSSLPLMTWVSFITWTSIGLGIYFAYSKHRSR
jgi:APA family basic amino acid/polyamine antiporter